MDPPPGERTTSIQASRVLGERYELTRLIGAGGAAEVWRATDRRLRRQVAVKLLAGPAARDPSHRRRIEREARALAAISHPNVVSVYDYAEEELSGGEPLPYLVLELVEGPDLAGHLTQHGRLPVDEAVSIVLGVLEGVRQAHAIGIVHGDLKPANVLCAPDGPKVGDFGVARILAEETGTTKIAATPTYAAPEVLRGERPTQASDVFSAACIAFEALAGRPPFSGHTFWDVANQHLHRRPDRLTAVRPEVPEGLADAVAVSLERDPARRPPDAAAFAASIDSALEPPSPADVRDRDTVDPGSPPTVPIVHTPTEVLDPPPARRRTRSILRAIPIGLLLAALAVGALAFLSSRATATARVPDLRGMDAAAAEQLARSEGFQTTRREIDRGGVAGTVVEQEPGPGELRTRGTTVVLGVTRGAPQVEVPDVTGFRADDARAAIAAAGLNPTDVSYQPSTEAAPGAVIRTIPDAGETVDEGSEVHIIAAAFPVDDDKDEKDEKDDDDDRRGRRGSNRGPG